MRSKKFFRFSFRLGLDFLDFWMFRKECRKLAMKVMIRYKWSFQGDMLIEPAITCVNIFSRQARYVGAPIRSSRTFWNLHWRLLGLLVLFLVLSIGCCVYKIVSDLFCILETAKISKSLIPKSPKMSPYAPSSRQLRQRFSV